MALCVSFRCSRLLGIPVDIKMISLQVNSRGLAEHFPASTTEQRQWKLLTNSKIQKMRESVREREKRERKVNRSFAA